jgi:NADP-dependent 3-hydroxy acid dehydrogenase YdfG
MRGLQGKAVVITGAASGIGRELALQAAAAGGVLALSDWDEAGLEETARLVRAGTGAGLRTDVLDVRDRAAVQRYAAAVRRWAGRVDVVVNNAGVALHGEVQEMSYDDLAWVMDIDFWGVVHGSKEFLPYLVESGDGHLVNMSSLFGLMSTAGQSAYNAAKFAVRGFTEALRQEMVIAGHPVQVTCVHPGGVRTAIARNARTTASHDPAVVARHFDTRLARTPAARAAEVVWAGALAGRPRVLVGTDARLLDLAVRLLGSRYQDLLIGVGRRSGRAAAVSRGAAPRRSG